MYQNVDDIRNEYELNRLKNLVKYDQKKEKVYEAHPVLKEYDQEIVDLYSMIPKTNFDSSKTKEIESKIADLKNKRSKYQKEHNVDDSYREVEYTCEKCKDTGYVDGKKCSCFLQKEIELFDSISHFKEYIKEDNFDNLDTSLYNQKIDNSVNMPYSKYMSNVIMHMKDGIRTIEEAPYNLMLIGPTGTGKTFLARCVGAEMIKKNKSVLYLNVNEYLNSLKPDYTGVVLEPYAIACDMLILDDLGTEYSTEFTKSKLNYITDKRINDKKSTIITTNLMLDELRNRYLDSMFSRINHVYTRCYLAGDDLRGVKNANI